MEETCPSILVRMPRHERPWSNRLEREQMLIPDNCRLSHRFARVLGEGGAWSLGDKAKRQD
eukprot:11201371-Lingulodinium_polyedra.AAC.1